MERGQPITALKLQNDRLLSSAKYCTLWDVNTLNRVVRFNLSPNNSDSVVSSAFTDKVARRLGGSCKLCLTSIVALWCCMDERREDC